MKPSLSDPYHSKSGFLEEELENRILHGLSLEWESAMGILPRSGFSCMKKPVFSLKKGKKNLAHWDASKREIAFSRSFVHQYPWDAVREVLIHEMAHQYAHEVLLCHDETAHGPGFRKACQILRANPKASGTYRPLTDRLRESETSDEDKILLKIRKLLALGESKNQFEAESALSKARMMIKKFNVSVSAHKEDPSFISMFVGEPALRRFKEDYLLTRLLVDHYGVFGIWISAYVMHKGKMGRVFEITGRPENVKTAAYVYDFIINQMNMAWELYNKGKAFNRYHKSDFACGLIQGFRSGLDHEKNEMDTVKTHQTDLMALSGEDTALMEYTANKYPRVRRFKRQGGSGDEKIHREGKKIGEKLVLSKAIEKNQSPKKLRLPFHKT